MDGSSAQSTAEKGIARRGLVAAVTAVIAALAVGIALLSVSCAPEQRASASQVDQAQAAVVEAAPAVAAEAAPVAAAVAEPAESVPVSAPEASAPAAEEPSPPDTHAILTDRSGDRAADEALLAPEAVPAAEKQANAEALAAARAAAKPVAYTLTVSTAVEKTPTPTPKPAPKPAAPKPVAQATPRVLTNPTGGWVELPNVRPIPGAYYNAVHQWDSIVNHFAGVYRIDPDLIRRIIYTESKGYQYAYVASTGVKGLMQITPMWFKAGENPYDPYTNIGKGSYILRRGYDAYHTWFLAVTYYCYGPLGRYGGNVPTFYAGLIFSPIIRSL